MKIEFIKAYEDKTWDTEVIDVPDDIPFEEGRDGDECPKCKSGTLGLEDGSLVCRGECGLVLDSIPHTSPDWDAAIIAYCHDHLAAQTQYRDIVYWGIYNSEPEDEEG